MQYLTAKEAGRCLLGSLSAVNQADGLYIFSAHKSIQEYRTSPQFDLLRQYIPCNVAVEYAGDVDSVYSLLEDVFENDDDEQCFGKPAAIPEQVRDDLTMQLHSWNREVFCQEMEPQAKALGLSFHRDLIGGYLLAGDRLMCVGPPMLQRSA